MLEPMSQKNLVTKPIRERSDRPDIRGTTPAMTYISDLFFPQAKIYVRWGWIFDIPNPNPHVNPHSHDYDEFVIHIGTDPNDPEDLGGELEFVVNGEPIVINKTSALYIQKGIKHGPLMWKQVTRPHLEMSIIAGTGAYLDARPGGYFNPTTV